MIATSTEGYDHPMTRRGRSFPQGDEPVPREVQLVFYRNTTLSGALAGALLGTVLGAATGLITGVVAMMAEDARRAHRRKERAS